MLYLLYMFPYVGICSMNHALKVQVGCVVGRTHKKGPDYTTDAALVQCDESEKEMAGTFTLMVQVHVWPVQGV